MAWSRFFRRRSWDEERAREVEAYLEQETADNLARGMTPHQAHSAARRKLGNTTLIREEIYRMNSMGFVESFWQDLRYAFRVLRKSSSFTMVAMLSLALGIGATTAIFSVVYGVLISPYPYAHPEHIWAPQVRSIKAARQDGFTSHHLADFLEVRKLTTFSDVMATLPEMQILTGDHTPENFTAVRISANGFQFLGVPPVLGRTILPSDVRPGGQPEPVIVLSFRAWQRLFDGRPEALGKTLLLNEQPYTVIGVMPPRFGWYTNDGGWLPLATDLREDRMVNVIMRLRPGVSKVAAEQQLQSLHLQLAQANPKNFPKDGFATSLLNYLDVTVASGEMQSSLQLLFGAVGFLLLIACANVANLQMARAASRAHEIAVRMSVGAARFRLLRQLLTESVLLSLSGGVLGVLLAFALIRGVVSLMPEFYVPNEARITVNGYVLLFSAGVSVLTGILFGLMPALRCSRPDLVGSLKDAGRSSVAAAGGRTRNLLVIAEVALSVILLVGASLTIRGFLNLQSVDVGFQPDRVLMVGVQFPPKRYPSYEQRIAFTQKVLERVQSIPGVQSAAIGNGGMPFGGPQSGYSIEGHPQAESRRIIVGLISAGYLPTLGIPLRAGRGLTESEVARGEHVALVNEAAAKLWPAGESPIGRRLRIDVLDKPPGSLLAPPVTSPYVTVIGIMADTRNDGLRNPTLPAAFVPYTVVAPSGRLLAVRTQARPMQVLKAVEAQVQSIDKDQPLNRPITLEEILGFETVQPRFNMALFSFFGMLGLAFATVGIYSLLSYTVARRTHEIGIRMALGAERSHVLGLMLAMGGKLVLVGLLLGMAGSLLLVRLLRSEVFQVPATDPLAVAGVVLLLTSAALLACFIPARRAARLDPVVALRHE